MSVSKIKLRRGTLEELGSITLEIGEAGLTLDTKEIFYGTNEGNSNPVDRGNVLMPTNWSDKTSVDKFWARESGGPSDPVYDPTDSQIGKGSLLFPTGTSGVWLLERFYPVSPLVGIGGYFCIKGQGTFDIGVNFYDSNFNLLAAPGGTAQSNFMGTFSGTASNWTMYKGYLQGEGGVWDAITNRSMPTNTRFIKPRITIISNDNARVDAFSLFPSSPFSMIASYV